MALPLGKLVIVIGAGIAGSVLINEGRVSKVSDFVSGAFKVVLKHLKDDDSSSKEKPIDNTLMAQVDSLRQELQRLSSSRSITVVTGNSQSGTGTYVMPVIVIGVAGYGYIWWKGWKLSDMMFATRRSFSDACSSIGKQLDQVSAAISAAKRHLSSRIDLVDNSLDECAELNAITKDEVFKLRGDLKNVGFDVESVQRAVQGLEFKIGRIEGKQDMTNEGVLQLCQFVRTLEERRQVERIQVSSTSKPSIEYPNSTSSPHSHHQLALELPVSASSSGSSDKGPASSPRTPEQRTPPSRSDSGLKEVQGISEGSQPSIPCISETKECEEHRSNISSAFGWKFPGAAFLQRSRSATCSFNKGMQAKP
uniref:DUF1664 domain-containing protein n=1 Tax=Araucaria cunninghamii TaxID=56994 RepID=A0A0D6R0V6_ARACU